MGDAMISGTKIHGNENSSMYGKSHQESHGKIPFRPGHGGGPPKAVRHRRRRGKPENFTGLVYPRINTTDRRLQKPMENHNVYWTNQP